MIPAEPDLPSELELGLPDWLVGATEPATSGGTGVLSRLPFDLSASLDPSPSVADVPAAPAEAPAYSPQSRRGLSRRVGVVPTVKDGDVTYRLPLAKAITKACHNCVVRFRLPAGITSAKATHRALLTNGVVLWSLGDVRVHDTRTLTLRFPAPVGTDDLTRGLFEIVADPVVQHTVAVQVRAPEWVGVGELVRLDVAITNTGTADTPPLHVRLEPDAGSPAETLADPIPPGETTTLPLETVATAAGPWGGQVVALANGVPLAAERVIIEAILTELTVACLVADTVRVDEMVTVRLRVGNPSWVPARGVTVAFTVADEFEFAAVGHGGEYDRATAQVGWYLGDLAPGEERDVTAEVTVIAIGPTALQAGVESANGAAATTSANVVCEIGDRMRLSALDRFLADLDSSLAPDSFDERLVQPELTGERHIVFTLGAGTLAVPLTHIREVLRQPTVTPVPFVADWITGVANVRGDIVSVVELAAVLGLDHEPTDRRSVLIAEGPDELIVGLLVDRVTGIRLLSPSDFEALDGEFDSAGCVVGLTRYQGKLVQLLDLDRVLHAVELGEVVVPN